MSDDPPQPRTLSRPPSLSVTIQLKPPRLPFPPVEPKPDVVRICHPGYPETQNTLLLLPAHDNGRGLHHGTARIACGILANCRWDGFLSRTPDAGGRVLLDDDDLLDVSHTYFFVVPGETRYPVVPSFLDFRFPASGPLPDIWRHPPIQPTTTDRAAVRDGVCRVTASAYPNEIAHLVPARYDTWWRDNNMFRYAAEPDGAMNTECVENVMLLRKDVHHSFDEDKWVIVPKTGRWVCHVLANPPTGELVEGYHNRELVRPLSGVAAQYLFARFALAIFSHVNVFVARGVERTLVVIGEDGTQKVETLGGDEVRARYGADFKSRSKSRSQSPRKRKAGTAAVDDDADDSSDDDQASRWLREQEAFMPREKRRRDDCDSVDGENRGRSRTRKRVRVSEPLSESGGGEPWSADTSFSEGHIEDKERMRVDERETVVDARDSIRNTSSKQADDELNKT